MRKLSLLAAAGLLVLPMSAQAKTLNELLLERGIAAGGHGSSSSEHAKVYYNNGTPA